jgi:proline dehydrogenase
MEESRTVDSTLAVLAELRRDHPGTGAVLQAMLHRTEDDARALATPGSRVRLVKGAYAEPIEVAHQGRAEIRAQYRFLTDWLFRHGCDPAFGTHDDELIAHARTAAAEAGRGPREFEFQFLYGIRRDLQQQLVDQGHRVRVYIPFGSAWYPYLTRRMAERPANLLFFLRALVGR